MALDRVLSPPPAAHITVKQLRERVRISAKTIYRYIDIGELPAKDHGGRWVFHLNAVRAFEKRHPERVIRRASA